MNTRTIIPTLLICVLFLSTAVFSSDDLSSVFPDSPLVYLWTENMTSNIDSYLRSDFGSKYLETAAFTDFANSKLYRKLGERFENWEKLIGLSIHINNIREFAGNESAMAVYDIGQIHVLFATRITYPQYSKSKLFSLKAKFQSIKIEDTEVFIKEGGTNDQAFAFGLVGDMLLIGTKPQLLEDSIKLLKGKSSASLAKNPNFNRAMKGLDGDFRLYMEIGKLTADNYFKTYWLHRNVPSLKWMEAGGSAVKLNKCGATETNRYLRYNTEDKFPAPIKKNGLKNSVPSQADTFSVYTIVVPEILSRRIITRSFELPVPSEEERLTEQDKLIVKSMDMLNEYLKTSGATEVLEAVKSDIGTNPFNVKLFAPTVLLDAKTDELLFRDILTNIKTAIVKTLSYSGKTEIEIKKMEIGGWMTLFIDTPFILKSSPFIAYKGNMIIFGNGPEIWKEVSTKTGSVSIPDESIAYSEFQFANTGGKILKTVDMLKNAPGWGYNPSKEFYTKNMSSLYNLFKSIEKVTVTDRVDDGNLLRTTEFKCSK